MQVTPSGKRPFLTPPTPNAPDLESATFANRGIVVLPDEMVIRILMYLGTTDIAVCRSVNRHWQTLIDTSHLLARSFYRDCHLTQQINSPAAERSPTVERYHSHIRGWLTDFGNGGRETAKQLDNILKDRYFPEVLFFSIPKLLLNSNELTYQNIAAIGHSGIVKDASFSPDGKYLATVSNDSAAKLWWHVDGQWREKVTLRHSARVLSTNFSPDSKLLMTASVGGICKIWRLEDNQWQEKFTIQHSSTAIDESFSPDGKHLVIVSDGDSTAKLWELEGGQWREKVTFGHCACVMSASFSSDAKNLVTTSADGVVKIWKFDDGQWEEKFTIDHRVCVTNARFSPDGKHLVTVTYDYRIHNAILWELVDVQSQENVTIQQWQGNATIEHSDIVRNVHFSLDGKHFATASYDGSVKICGLEGGKWQEKATIRHSHHRVANVSFSRNSKFLVTASHGCIAKICGLVGGQWQEIVTIEHSREVTNASFGRDDYQFVTVSSDNPAKVWVLKNKENDHNS